MATPGDNQLPRFERQFFDAAESSTRIGRGAIGGKAAGLERVRRDILPRLDPAAHPQFRLSVPRMTVLTTGLFERFMERNGLYPVALSDAPDERIAHAFQQGDLPAEYVGDLLALIRDVHTPLAVRSSSLLEDALAHPFAGVYGTKMIPNNQPSAEARFQRLVEAIKFVYASAFFAGAKSYLRSIDRPPDAEQMAVVIQEIVGERRNERFYPHLSGVARSFNYYPSGRSRPEEGVVNLALGLGKQIVDGGLSWTYCPARPQAPPPFANIGERLKNSQTVFWAVGMGKPPAPDPTRETEYLVRAGLAEAELDGTLEFLVSTLDPRSDRLRPGLAAAGPRVLDFAPILTGGALDLNPLLQELLRETERELGAAVEIEFALTLDRRRAHPARFGFLQARPMMVSTGEVEIATAEKEEAGRLIYSTSALGNGVREDIRDVVYVRPDVFEAKHTPRIALEIERLNRELVAQGRPYLLIGFGRWGSSDPWLGIPVEWGQISGARALVETTLPQMNPDLSQGSHFFHNLISFQVLYFSVRSAEGRGVAWPWLEAQPALAETSFLRHIQGAQPLVIKVDGRRGEGVIRHA